MPSSWFRKPVYKQVRYASLLVFLICLGLGFLNQLFWIPGILYLVLWTFFTAFASYRIQSGFFVSSVNKIPTSGNNVYLTFDDGPHPQTNNILDLLSKEGVHASFFCIGKNLENYPDIAKRIVDEGHSLGNHSYAHTFNFPLQRPNAISEDVLKAQAILEKISGKPNRLFRPPFGVTNPMIAKALKKLNLITIGWSVRSLDTTRLSQHKILERIKKKIKPGSIILLHDPMPNSVILLREILDICKSLNLKPVSIDEAI